MVSAVTDKATVQSVSLEVIAERGFHGASMREIAKRVGTSLSNLYNYYPSKAALLCDVLVSGNEALHSAMVLQDVGRESDSDEELSGRYSFEAVREDRCHSALEVVRAATEYSLDNPVMMRMAVTEARYLSGEYREKVYAGQLRCIAVLRASISDHYGSSPPAGIDPHSTARSIMLLTSHLPDWLKSSSSTEQRNLADRHLVECSRLMGIKP